MNIGRRVNAPSLINFFHVTCFGAAGFHFLFPNAVT
jgi:hypothetical protein